MKTTNTTRHRLLTTFAATVLLVGSLAAGLHHHDPALGNLFESKKEAVSVRQTGGATLAHAGCALCRAAEQKSALPAPTSWFGPFETVALTAGGSSSGIVIVPTSAARPRAPPQASAQLVG